LKRFKKKRIVIGTLVAIVAVLALAGGVFAAYNFWNASAEVKVTEAMAVYVDGSWHDPTTYTWEGTVSPGDSISKDFIVRNNGTADLGIIPVVDPVSRNAGKVLAEWDKGKTTVSPESGAQVTFTLTINAAGDATPNTYPFNIYFEREDPTT
jgi:type VI protein secretion system component VasK